MQLEVLAVFPCLDRAITRPACVLWEENLWHPNTHLYTKPYYQKAMMPRGGILDEPTELQTSKRVLKDHITIITKFFITASPSTAFA